jgi:hypothetical protein
MASPDREISLASASSPEPPTDVIAFARTVVLMPFRVPRAPSDPHTAEQWEPGDFRDGDPRQSGVARWREASHENLQLKGVRELLPHFRRLMTGHGDDGPTPPHGLPAAWRRHVVADAFVHDVLGRFTPAAARVDGLAVSGRITAVDCTVFPTGEGLFGLEFTWLPETTTIADLANLVPLMRRADGNPQHRYEPFWTVAPHRGNGPDPTAGLTGATPDGRLQLKDILAWLIGPAHIGEIAPTGLGAAHTTIVLRQPPADRRTLEPWLFHIAHAVPPTFQPPSDVRRLIEILEPRGNRLIGIAREGAVAIGWPAAAATEGAEIQWASNRFHGVYRLLHMHVHAERMAIAGLSDAAARFANMLDDNALLVQQHRIEQLLVNVTRYTLSLTGEDCGGNGDHVNFFAALRRVHRIPGQRDELRAEIDELRALLRAVDSRRAEEIMREERDFQRRVHEANEEERIFQRRISTVGFFAVPLSVVLGVLGANVRGSGTDAQTLFDWSEVAWMITASLATGAAFWFGSRVRRKQREDRQKSSNP